MDQWSITLVKRFTYRGDPLEEFSNKYHLAGDMPTSPGEWKALSDAIWVTESEIMRADVHLVTAYGYEASVPHSVAQIDYLLTGGAGPAGGLNVDSNSVVMPGDAAAYLRCYAGTQGGRKTYVKKFYHGGYLDASAPDEISGPMEAAMNTHGAAMLDGHLPGDATWVQEQGRALSLPLASKWVTTRTLKRRGKRPTSP